MNINFLTWDSEFFHKRTGRINFEEEEQTRLNSLLNKGRSQGYQLLYLYASGSVFLDDEILIPFNGKLVDRKVLYRLNFQNLLKKPNGVEEYTSSELSDDLEELAYLSGSYSRFHLDKNFASDSFYRLYYTWITKSIRKEIADKIFIIKDSGKIAGMVTLKHDKSWGKIGLIAVLPPTQGKGYGTLLIEACKKSLCDSNIFILYVTTQLANQSACLFYEKCGFEKEQVTNIFHFWL